MRVRGFLILSCLTLGPLGCSSSLDGMGEQQAYVLLDREARQNSMLLHGNWKGNPVLPTEFDDQDSVVWRMNSGESEEMPIVLQAGKLAYLHANPVEIEWMELGTEVRDDRLLLNGSEESLNELAGRMGASISARGDGYWTFSVEGLFARGSFVETGADILEAVPDTWVETGNAEAGVGSDTNSIVFNPGLLGGEEEEGKDAMVPGRAEALSVGIYSSGSTLLVLDGSGHFSLSDICTGDEKDSGYFYAGQNGIVLRSKHSGNQALVPTGSGWKDSNGVSFKSVDPAKFSILSYAYDE